MTPKRSNWSEWLRRDPIMTVGIILLLVVVGLCVLAPFLPLPDPAQQDLNKGLTSPSTEHLLGTDQLGRDLLSRLAWAGQTSLGIAVSVLVLSLLIGSLIGACAGYFGGLVDESCMRVVDLFLSLPTLILALALVSALGSGFGTLILVLTISWWPSYARLVRSQTLAVRSTDYVLAARAVGCPNVEILRRHIAPALLGPLSVQLSLDTGHLILAVASFGFLGLGVQPPRPEWGAMLVEARPYLSQAPHLILAPGLAIFCTVFGANALAAWVESELNPWR